MRAVHAHDESTTAPGRATPLRAPHRATGPLAAPVAPRAAAVLNLQRRAGNAAVTRALEQEVRVHGTAQPAVSVQRAPDPAQRGRTRTREEEGEWIPMSKLGGRRWADEAVRKAGGTPLRRDSSSDSHLNELWDEADQQLSTVPLVETDSGQPAQAHFAPGQGHRITYDPAYVDNPYNGDTTDARHFATASMLHEAHHVRSDHTYRRPSDPQAFLAFNNFHLPTEEGAEGEPVIASMGRQVQRADQNLDHARGIIERDPGLDARMRAHLTGRLDYAQGSGPAVHYDTVLADMLQYMHSSAVHETETYRYLRSLSREAHDRRNNITRDNAEVPDMR